MLEAKLRSRAVAGMSCISPPGPGGGDRRAVEPRFDLDDGADQLLADAMAGGRVLDVDVELAVQRGPQANGGLQPLGTPGGVGFERSRGVGSGVEAGGVRRCGRPDGGHYQGEPGGGPRPPFTDASLGNPSVGSLVRTALCGTVLQGDAPLAAQTTQAVA